MPRWSPVAGGTCALILLVAPVSVAPAGALAKTPPRLAGVNYPS